VPYVDVLVNNLGIFEPKPFEQIPDEDWLRLLLRHLIWIVLLILSLAGCSDTVNIAPALGWPAGGRPTAAEGTAVNVFADNLDHPRWLYVLSNGDVLVAESNVGNIIWRVTSSDEQSNTGKTE